VILLSALWLAVVQAFASPAVPAGGPARAAEVTITASVSAIGVDGARNEREAGGTGSWAALHREGELRPTAPQRLTVVDRTCGRGGAPPIRASAGQARLGSADLSRPAACVPPPAHQVSHAAASRGGHLPYYPTPPPEQG
jgi:hypothetical protein